MWLKQKYIDNRYLFLLGKLDDHIIERNLNYPLYMNCKKDRKIKLDAVLDWLICDNIETSDESFYPNLSKKLYTCHIERVLKPA